MAEPDYPRETALPSRTRRPMSADAVLAATIFTALFFAFQFFYCLDIVKSHDGWGGLAFLVVWLPVTVLAVIVALALSFGALSRENSAVAAKWSVGLAVAMALLLVLEIVLFGSTRLEG